MLEVQRHDALRAQLVHKRAGLAQRADLAAVQSRLGELEHQRVDISTRVSDLGRQQRQVDGEVELARARKQRDEARMASGSVNAKDLTGLQHELEALDRRIGALEDDELEVMEALEQAQAELADIESRIETDMQAKAELVEALSIAEADIDQELGEIASARAAASAKVSTELLALYDKLAASYGGVGAAELKGSACQGCRLDITGTDLREVQSAAPDEIVRCPECSRILVRLP